MRGWFVESPETPWRSSVTAPVTTERIAFGGFNSTGLRVERLPPPIGIRRVKFPVAPPR